jgi:hypothetical protein
MPKKQNAKSVEAGARKEAEKVTAAPTAINHTFRLLLLLLRYHCSTAAAISISAALNTAGTITVVDTSTACCCRQGGDAQGSGQGNFPEHNLLSYLYMLIFYCVAPALLRNLSRSLLPPHCPTLALWTGSQRCEGQQSSCRCGLGRRWQG